MVISRGTVLDEMSVVNSMLMHFLLHRADIEPLHQQYTRLLSLSNESLEFVNVYKKKENDSYSFFKNRRKLNLTPQGSVILTIQRKNASKVVKQDSAFKSTLLQFVSERLPELPAVKEGGQNYKGEMNTMDPILLLTAQEYCRGENLFEAWSCIMEIAGLYLAVETEGKGDYFWKYGYEEACKELDKATRYYAFAQELLGFFEETSKNEFWILAQVGLDEVKQKQNKAASDRAEHFRREEKEEAAKKARNAASSIPSSNLPYWPLSSGPQYQYQAQYNTSGFTPGLQLNYSFGPRF